MSNTVTYNDNISTTNKSYTRLYKLDNDYITNENYVKGDNIRLLWCDSHLYEEQFADDITLTSTMLHDINNCVHMFSCETECITYLNTICKIETIILIVSGALASETLLDKANRIRQVDTIFIFCIETKKYETLLQHSKVVGICNDRETLKYNIMKTMRSIERQSTILQMYDTTKQKLARNLDRETGSFVWLQLIKEVIQKISATKTDIHSEDFNGKQEMLRQCREYYRDNEKELKNIKEFEETYIAKHAIKWYTKDSFIFKLINKALRTENIEVLYTFRFYIVHLCTALTENSQLLREYTNAYILKVYRGMKHSYEEIERLKSSIGQLISANGFLSASRSKSVAEAYAGIGNNNNIRNDLESVIFDIEIDMIADHPVVVADVTYHSHFKDEEEVLFDLGTVFEIKSISYNDIAKFWTCSMRTSTKGYDIAQEYIQLEREEMNKGDVEILLGTLLFKMGEYEKSIVYLNHLKIHKPDDAYILFILGKAHGVLYQHEQALSYYENAYNISMNKDPPDLAHAALINTFAGQIHRYECNYDKALSICTDSLNKYRSVNMTEQVPFAHTLIGLGYIHFRLGMDNIAYDYFQRALKIMQKQAPHNLPDLCRAHRHVATVLYQMGDYDNALQLMNVSHNIGKQIFTENSLSFCIILDEIGKILYKKGQYEQALIQHLDACEIKQNTFPLENRLNFVSPYNNIGKVFYRMKKYNDANEYYDKTILILNTILVKDHVDTAYTFKNKGELLLGQGYLDDADDYLNRSLSMYERIFVGREHRDKAKCKYLIGCLYMIRGDDKQAICLFRQAYETWSKTLKVQHPDRNMCLKTMSQLQWKKIYQWISKQKKRRE